MRGAAIFDWKTGLRGGEPPPDLSDLHEHQAQGVAWLSERENALLADEPGVGKTATFLRALPRLARTIVACPASALLTWSAETARWRPDLRVRERAKIARPAEREIRLVSFGQLDALREGEARIIDQPMRDVHLLVDEAHMVKSPETLRSKRIRALRAQCGVCWGSTATPMPGQPEDLWGVLVSLGLDHVFASWDEFAAMFGGKTTGRGIGWGDVSPEVRARLAPIMLRRRADDVLKDLPERRIVDVPTTVPRDLRPFLDRVKKQWDSVNPDALPPFRLLAEAMLALARSKIPAALELADKYAASVPLLVFSAHEDPVLAVGELPGFGAFVGATPVSERRELVRRFQAGELRGLAMSIGTGGVALNLQRAGGVLFVDRSYNPGDNDQAYDRARRQGNTLARVFCWRMISDHPLDRHLSKILDVKQRRISATYD